MFSLFVRRDGLIEPPVLGKLDAHCHILPGIDDGPVSMEGSVAIASLLVEMGVEQVVATPHVISDLYPNSSETIFAAAARLRSALLKQEVPLEVIEGAEYYAEPGFVRQIEQRDILCFGAARFVLFECPVEHPPLILDEIVFALRSNGYTPLLAHAERYRFLQQDAGLIKDLRDAGVQFQVNHPSFHLPRTSRRGEMARSLYIKGLVDVLGTDLHRATPWATTTRSSESRSFFRSLTR